MLIELKGQIEQITYSSDETGYTVARLKVYGQRDLVTVVGNMMSPTVGEVLHMQGEWTRHPKFGQQFKIHHYKTAVPASVDGIRKYLGSGLIKGIGPVMAKRIVKEFGAQALDVIEADPERLSSINGIGPKRVRIIRNAWEAQKEIRQVMLFLQSHGVSSGYATKIFKQYGDDSITVVQENPYRLAMDIFGIGFVTADRIAENIGFAKDAPVRLQAGAIYLLHQLSDEGHVYCPHDMLIDRIQDLLGVDRQAAVSAVTVLDTEKRIVIDRLELPANAARETPKAVYLEKYYVCETAVARRLTDLIGSPKRIQDFDADTEIKWVQRHLAITLADKQAEAVQGALCHKAMVITGGPGTGKTTIINAILKIFRKITPRLLLAAPTGRAAKRMSEATGRDAKTIHRLLEFSPGQGGFQKTADSPLDCDLLIVDEASMVDILLMHHLLKAVPAGATVILVGDVNQLPSVGAGNVLNDIIISKALPVVTLNEIFRQARESRIIVGAHQINNGIVPFFDNTQSSDFFFREEETPEKALAFIVDMVKTRIPNRFGLTPQEGIQVLTPMHKGIVGAGNLNAVLQDAVNPGAGGITRGGHTFRPGDKVMQIKNNYDKDVFNGDIGQIDRFSNEAQEAVLRFDGREVVYDYSELDEIVLAYAVSVHKSQGSEYPAVVIPIMIQHYVLLQRNLIYTAVTRGKRLVVMVGTRKALAIAVRNDKTLKRFTRLDYRLSP